MRARLLISLAVLLSTTFGRARADEPAPGRGPATSEEAQAPLDPAKDATAARPASAYPPLDEEPPTNAALPAKTRPAGRAFLHPTVDGLLGGVHAVDAGSAWPGTFRMALYGHLFRRDGFIQSGDRHRRAGGVLIANVSVIEHLELAAQLATYTTANDTTAPRVIQTIGDIRLFAKGYARVLPWLSAGGDLEVALLNRVGDIGVRGGATGVGLRGNATFDLRALREALPILARANMRYQFDNSARLVREVEQRRLAALDDRASDDEYRHLISPSERYALGVNRLDRFGLGVGFEFPFHPRERVHVSPLLEWAFWLPVNRQGYSCLVTRVPGQDSCLAREGFGARPSVLTLGVRAQPYVPGLSLLFAVDLATSGSRTFVRELAPTERYTLQFGVSYAYDPRPRPVPPPRVVRVEVPTREVRAHIEGQVVDAETGKPIDGAIVHFEGTSLSDLVSDAEGRFRSAELAPGPQGMRIHADGFREALCVAVVASTGGDVQARCELAPSVRYGTLEGRVVDAAGSPLAAARLLLRGPTELTVTANSDGSFESNRVPAGEYEVEAQAENYFSRRLRARITAGERSRLGVTLHVRSRTPQVRLTKSRIVLNKPLLFREDNSLDAKSETLLVEVVDLLRTHPELTTIEIQGHVDPQADAAAAQAMSEQRANAVRSALLDGGIAPSRLEAVGYGASKPLVPNITAANRARNRRIELVIK